MSSIYPIVDKASGKFNPPLFEKADSVAKSTTVELGDYAWAADGAKVENKRLPVEVRPRDGGAGPKGWIETAALRNTPLSGAEMIELGAPFSKKDFIRNCARTELAFYTGTTSPSFAASAEFMIALSWIESGLESFDNQLGDLDAYGMFQITKAQWTKYTTDNPGSKLDELNRFDSFWQISCFAYLLETAFFAFKSKYESADGKALDPEKPLIPSFLNLFHAWLFGADIAVAIDKANQGNNPNQPLDAVTKASANDAVALLRARRLFPDMNSETSVKGFVITSSEMLKDGFKKALELLIEHAPGYVKLPENMMTPWMNPAKTEYLEKWNKGELDETTADGKANVDRYFKEALGINNGASLAWCGAFASYCMVVSGDETAKKSLVPVAERAANWLAWGNIGVPIAAEKYPDGAVIVLAPSPGTDSSGHVTFYKRHLNADKIECLGGNQGNTLKLSSYDVSRVRAVRLLQIKATGTDENDDELVLAQTIYGEARGEATDDGRKAVAQVIRNRVNDAKKRYGKGFAGVCLKSKQFSCWNAGDPNRAEMLNEENWETAKFKNCRDIAKAAIAGNVGKDIDGALHYHATGIAKPSWVISSATVTKTATIGGHVFYKNVDGLA